MSKMTVPIGQRALVGGAIVALAASATFQTVALAQDGKPNAGAGETGTTAPPAAPARPGAEPVVIDGITFGSWAEYFTSEYFRLHGKRCGTIERFEDDGGIAGGAASDCSSALTNPGASYTPSCTLRYRIPVVVHIYRTSAGTGNPRSAADAANQITVLNEDFKALAGTPGAPGTNCEVEFYLTNDFGSGGVFFHNNDIGYNDTNTSYMTTDAKDPNNYLNIYVQNLGGGLLGYASIPQSGGVGAATDGVHILYAAFGDNVPGGAPYDLGRTATHEVGHYLGLYHTFQSGCGTTTAPGCYSTGDRICDTNAESAAYLGCNTSIPNTCGDGPDPTTNYMDYTQDLCMNRFTPEQAKRIRCTLEWWRPSLADLVNTCGGTVPTFTGNFLSTPNLLYSDVAAVGTTFFNAGSPQPGISDGSGEGAFIYAGSIFTQVGNEVGYKILHAGGNLRVTLSGLATDCDLLLLGAAGTPASTLQRSETGGVANETVFISNAAAGTYYAVVDTFGSANTGSAYSIKYEAPPVGLNIDVNASTGVAAGAPSNTFGAAAGQVGSWTAMTDAAASANMVTLGNINTAMTVSRTGGAAIFTNDNVNTTGNHQLLLDDVWDVGAPGNPAVYTFAHLPKGTYDVYTYAIAPDSAALLTSVNVTGSTSTNPQIVGGAMPVNAFTPGVTHSVHRVTVVPGANLVVTCTTSASFGSVNGFQLKPLPACAADVNGNNSVDVADLLAVISSWGACPGACPPNCAADVVPNCQVDVADLLAVISAWGPCP